MKASEIEVGMVIDQPDSRGYRVVKKANPGIHGYTTFYLIRVDDHHDRVTHTIPLTDEVGVLP